MITGQGLTIKPWTTTNEMPAGYKWRVDRKLRPSYEDAPAAIKQAYPWYQEVVFYHIPTRALWFPILESDDGRVAEPYAKESEGK